MNTADFFACDYQSVNCISKEKQHCIPIRKATTVINEGEVPYGTKGRVRPDYYKDGFCVDIKNYNVESASGRSNLARNIEKQYYQRIENLPDGTKQSVIKLDGVATGRTYSTNISEEMKKKILEGQRAKPNKNEVIGGHSPNINNNNAIFAVEELSVNSDGTKNIKYVKDLLDGNISKIKKSTIFPDTWSETDIIESIRITGDSPVLSTRARDGATFHRQIINDVEIDVIKIENNVISGYPTGKVGAPYPSGF